MRTIETLFFPSLDSTQSYAKSCDRSISAPQILCIQADEQTGGYGRFGRPWISPKAGNLYATYRIAFPLRTPAISSLSLVAGLSLCEALEPALAPQIKWPNDIQINGKKLAGILCETRVEDPFLLFFLGLGVNVNAFPDSLEQPATSLFAETNRPWPRDELKGAFEKQLLFHLETWSINGFAPFQAPCEARLAHRRERVLCRSSAATHEGTLLGLSQEGYLLLQLSNGSIYPCAAGEVQRLRKI